MPGRTRQNGVEGLQMVAADTEALLGRISRLSESQSRLNSSTLVGTFGGLSGTTLAYLLSVFFPAISFVFLSPLLTAGGLIAGILLFRGRSRSTLERQIDEHQIAYEYILRRLRTLPKNAPSSLRQDLLEELAFNTGRLRALSIPRSVTDGTAPLP